jgi:hypothetical protein
MNQPYPRESLSMTLVLWVRKPAENNTLEKFGQLIA